MAAYFHGAAEIHGDGLQTLYLMNPGFVGSADPSAAPAANLVFLSHHQQLQLLQQQQQNFVGIPLQPENSVAQSQNILMSSKYLRAAQELLDEVVSVGRGLCGEPPRVRLPDSARSGREAARGDVPDLTAAERQDLQIKKAKLVTMLDEVEQRYRQYSNHMGMVASYFEAVAGRGSARAYTALALQTISKQFRCLRDAIALQVRAAGRNLGEEESADGEAIKSIGSRLRLVDHHLRQQRALQQLGMMQHNAWRPQRGLPERAVSILRAWLFEHFLHPYPKDSDKLLLAKQTGLTRSQVSNWFINARVRLWKPMVEEMYVEDIKEQEQIQPKDKSGCSSTEPNEESTSKASSQTKTEQGSTSCTSKQGISNGAKLYDSIPIIPHAKHGNSQSMQPFSKKARNSADPLHLSADLPNALKLEMKAEEFSSRELLMKFMEAGSHPNNAGGFGAYSIGDIGRFDGEHFAPSFHGNDVSLTLGLQHCESLSMAEEEPPYLSNEAISMDNEASAFGSLGSNPQPDSHASIAYASMELQNRKRFAARLLPDFVA